MAGEGASDAMPSTGDIQQKSHGFPWLPNDSIKQFGPRAKHGKPHKLAVMQQKTQPRGLPMWQRHSGGFP